MSHIEASGFCKIEEYRAGESSRLMVQELIIDEFYVLMMAIKSNLPIRSASRNLTRVTRVEEGGSALSIVHFDEVDVDMQKIGHTTGGFTDGYWVDAEARKMIVKDSQGNEYPIVEGYFKAYKDGVGDGYLDENLGLLVGGRVLEGATSH